MDGHVGEQKNYIDIKTKKKIVQAQKQIAHLLTIIAIRNSQIGRTKLINKHEQINETEYKRHIFDKKFSAICRGIYACGQQFWWLKLKYQSGENNN